MATRKYGLNPDESDHAVTEGAGSATTKRIELTVDWDGLASDGLSGQQARLQVLAALKRLHAYIETSGKFNVNA